MDKVRYLCPICDHELVGNFCTSCKKIIKEPIKYKGRYLPNESHGDYELNKNCSYSSSMYTGTYRQYNAGRVSDGGTAQKSYSKQYTAANNKANSYDYGRCGGHKDSDYGRPNVDPHSKKTSNKKKGGIVKIVIVLYIMYIILNAVYRYFAGH